MSKLNRDELKKLRETQKKEISRLNPSADKIRVLVGLGSCGIAAGAKVAYAKFIEELEQHDIKNVEIKQTGCMGFCYSEPTVEVLMPGMPDTIYGNVDGEIASKIVRKHILGKALVSDYIYDKAAVDIIEGMEA